MPGLFRRIPSRCVDSDELFSGMQNFLWHFVGWVMNRLFFCRKVVSISCMANQSQRRSFPQRSAHSVLKNKQKECWLRAV